MLRESILLQEFFLDDFSNIKSEFLIFWQWVLTDQLNDFVELDFFVQDFLDGLSQEWEFLVKLVEIRVELSFVVWGWDGPIDWWEMLLLGEFLIKTPEDLYDGQSWGCDWISKVTTWWTDGTDNGNWTCSVWWTETSDFTGSFVELG